LHGNRHDSGRRVKANGKARSLPCHCGGTLRHGELNDFDFSSYVGVPVRLGTVPGYTCDACGGQTLDGTTIDHVEHVLALAITQKPCLVSPQEAKFLRKHLGLTQDKLAERLGVARETVARWEIGDAISPHCDFILRTVVLASFGAVSRCVPTKMVNDAVNTLTSVRKEAPSPRTTLDPVLVQTLLDKLRAEDRRAPRSRR
jgi:putative zinc finger/helix-turn-helix YgiT family protein